MLLPFSELRDEARIVIFQSDQLLSGNAQKQIEESLESFLSTWDSHGKPLNVSYKIFFDRFIIIGIDESNTTASGCAIDRLTGLIRSLENEFELSLLEKNRIALEANGEIQVKDFQILKKEIRNGMIPPETLVFNNSLTSLKEFKNHWRNPVENTWLSKYFNN